MPPEWGEWEKPLQFESDEPTLKLNPVEELCPCGQRVKDRKVNLSYIQLEKYSRKRHLSQSCSVCQKWYNPEDDEWQQIAHGARRAILTRNLKQKHK